MSDDSDYSLYGSNLPVNPSEADPVQCAIDGPNGINNTFTCAGNPRRRQIGLNLAFMSQRCSNLWDGYCDMYLKQEGKGDYTGKRFKEFIRHTLLTMFCQNDTSTPGSQCIERCEMYNPTSSSSFSVCLPQGDVVFRESYKQYNQTTLPYTLNTSNPIRIATCPKVCNLFDPAKLTDDNIPLNIALDNGISMDLIENLVKNIVSAGKQSIVTNQRLLNFMKQYVQDGSVKPGLYTLGVGPTISDHPVFTPAVNPYIPPQTTFTVAPSTPTDLGQFGTVSIPASNIKPELSELTKTSPTSPTQNSTPQVSNSENKSEPFGFLNLSDDKKKNCILLWAILIISLIAIVILLYARYKSKSSFF